MEAQDPCHTVLLRTEVANWESGLQENLLQPQSAFWKFTLVANM